jgi:hypothetical protein
MIDISFEVGGRKVAAGQFTNEIETAIPAEVKKNITTALGNVRCREHGERPSVVVKGSSLDNLRFEVHGCCEDLVRRASEKLK